MTGKQENKKTRKHGAGVVAFSTILILSAIIVEVGIAATVLVYFLNRSNYGVRLTNEAFAAARAGVDDAVIRVVRARIYPPPCTITYTVAVGSISSVDVSIQNVACSGESETDYVVTATGKALGKQRKLEATLDVDPQTREVRIRSVNEIAL